MVPSLLAFRQRKERLTPRGFSLMELMVVLVILGLIIGMVAPSIWRRMAQGRVVTTKAQVQSLSTAIYNFNNDMGRYPTTEEGLKALISNPDGSETWQGSYLEKNYVPKDAWQHDFVYRAPGTHDSPFDILSLGPDGQEGTADDITSWGK